jgi:hypothetical protein
VRIDPIEFVAKARGGSIGTGSRLTPAPLHRGQQFLGFDVVLLLSTPVAPSRRCSPRAKSSSPFLGRSRAPAGPQDSTARFEV